MFFLGAIFFLAAHAHATLPYQTGEYDYGSLYDFYSGPTLSPPLAVLAESPFSVARSTVDVPLILISTDTLRTIHNARISDVSPTEPLVTCQTNKYTTQATPAVQVVLKKALYVDPSQDTIPFPASMSIIYHGLRMGLPVGAVIAPIPPQQLQQPHYIRVVYAIPSGPLPLQYPYFDPYTFSQPPLPEVPFLPVAALRPSYASLYPPQHDTNALTGTKKQPPVTVTVLKFPSSIATPDILYYQPPLDSESELGNRGPPEAIVPAGIIQSAAPVPNIELFLNSKESPLLNALREEAEKNKNKIVTSNKGVEAL